MDAEDQALRMSDFRQMVVVAIFGLIFVSAIILSIFRQPKRHNELVMACISHLKQQGISLQMYAQDYDERFPPAEPWRAITLPYHKSESIYHCPEENDSRLIDYAFNRAMGGVDQNRVSGINTMVSTFDAVPGPNPVGGTELLPSSPRHLGMHNVGFVDGHAKSATTTDVAALGWRPMITDPKASK